MKSVTTAIAAAATIAASVVISLTTANAASEEPAPHAVSAELLSRGDYLVHRAGLCTDCHSPRGERGEFIKGKHLTGAPIAFSPTVQMPWATVAPRLAGLPEGFSEPDLVQFLMTGERPNGRPRPLPPMPPYRFSREDAEAIAAYLKSLPAEGS